MRKRLGRRYDGETDPDGAFCEEHLRHCQRCVSEVQDWRRIDRLLDIGLPEPGLSIPVAAAIERRTSTGWWLRAAVAASVTLALGAIGGSLIRNEGDGTLLDASAPPMVLEETFGPGSLRGIDDLAGDLDSREEESR